MRTLFSLVFITACSFGLTGCSVLGMLADSQLNDDRHNQNVNHNTGQITTTEFAAPFTELGIALDGAVINTVKKLTSEEKPKEVCKHNGYFTECRPAGKQRADLID